MPHGSAPAPTPSGFVERRDVAAASHHNRRRARAIAALPGVVVFGVVALVLTGVGAPLAGLVAGAAAGAFLWATVWLGASSFVLRSLHARRANEEDLPGAYNLVEGLCASMGLRLPAMWVVDDEIRDALALGRGPRTAALVLTSGLADALGPVAMEGVLAHELTHVKRCDVAPATISAALLMPLAVFLPGLGALVHWAAGRGREFDADRLAVAVTRYPPGLREALSEMVSGPLPRTRSLLAGSAVARTTRWLWTVSLPVAVTATSQVVGELDAVPVRIAALDEW